MTEDAHKPARSRFGLSARLLVLTVFFVMVAEVLIYVPSVARFRLTWLEAKMDQAHLAVLALEATPDGMVNDAMQARLLRHAGARGIVATMPDGTTYMLTPTAPPEPDVVIDLEDFQAVPWMIGTLRTLGRSGGRTLLVLGPSPQEMDIRVEVLLDEAPLIADMRDFSQRILLLSLVISAITATLVYLSLHLMLVRPMRRLTGSVAAFADDPENPERVIVPSGRGDEIGTAEVALRRMQTILRDALARKSRLADVGTGVAKISHDLRGILSSAMLESDRLEQTAGSDPEVREITAGLVDALDRAVALCSRTLRFAKEGPPIPNLAPLPLAALVDDALAALGEGATTWTNAVPADATVRADRDMTLRALTNLVTNAVEAGATSGEISVMGEDAGLMVLAIADDGPGLPAKARDNLFKPFSGSARRGGTGLGLPIARELARAQGGSLSLHRSDDKGTVFTLALRKIGRAIEPR